MIKLFAYFKQEGEGCDYTISCGEELIALKARTPYDARKEVRQLAEDRGFDSDSSERQCEKALILEQVEDVLTVVSAAQVKRRQDNDAALLASKRAQLKRLKKELGET